MTKEMVEAMKKRNAGPSYVNEMQKRADVEGKAEGKFVDKVATRPTHLDMLLRCVTLAYTAVWLTAREVRVAETGLNAACVRGSLIDMDGRLLTVSIRTRTSTSNQYVTQHASTWAHEATEKPLLVGDRP